MHQATILGEVERYRRWSTEQKRMICLEAFAEGACVRDVARKYELSAGQLYKWRRVLIKKGDPPGDYGVFGEFIEVGDSRPDAGSPRDPAGVDLALACLDDLLSGPPHDENRSRDGQRPVRERGPSVRNSAPGSAIVELRLVNGRWLRCMLTDDLDLGQLAALADLLERT